MGYIPPAGPVKMTFGQYQDALSACWSSVADWMKANGWGKRDIAYAERRAREVATCGETWKMPVCECGHTEERKAVLIEGCDSRTCPRCGKLASEKLTLAGRTFVDAHPVVREKGRVSRGYALTTLTEEKPPTITLAGLTASVKNVKKKGANVWKKVWRFNPRKKDGKYGKYPGKATDAGAIHRIELGPSGNVHGHALRYGAWHWSEDVRQAAGDTWTHDTKVKQQEKGKGGIYGAVRECLKYVTKSSTKPGRREFTQPALAVLFELATRGKRLVEGYGSMRGILKQAEDAYMEERQGVLKDDDERLSELGACPCCGSADTWKWKNVSRPKTWMPPRPRRQQAEAPGGTS